MTSVLALVPLRKVGGWVVSVLKQRDRRILLTGSREEAARLLSFIRFSAIVVWLPAGRLEEWANSLATRADQRPSVVVMSLAPSVQVTASPWFREGIDEAVPLPTSATSLRQAVERACAAGFRDAPAEREQAIRSFPLVCALDDDQERVQIPAGMPCVKRQGNLVPETASPCGTPALAVGRRLGEGVLCRRR
jgi:hypothetical protein